MGRGEVAASRSEVGRSEVAASRSELAACRNKLAANEKEQTIGRGCVRRRRVDRNTRGVLVLRPTIKTTREQIRGTMLTIQ